MKGKVSPFKGVILVPPVGKLCERCGNTFFSKRYKKRRFCNAICAGRRPTSPKASRGKSGTRPDISDSINFHSTWEANIARTYIHLGIEWQYEPCTFDIGEHAYTPDFYLPRYDEYIEIKNFWSPYSARRDMRFRETHPQIVLRVILKDEYRALEALYADTIPTWEYSGKRFTFG
jgi:predicted nuclease of restriction endonuclease-like RecB superfamily